ncbi:MAG TPA: DUF167 domain-containing protein [Candidatus Nanoarchaeia archaeon]|nr:DUF167 domain-containing protein [Candidatus Nanoarchaeia archaeon]
MIIFVRVKPSAREERVEKVGEKEYNIAVKAPARDGKANISVMKLLAKEFGVPVKNIRIKTHTGRKKIVEIAVT